MAAPGKPPWPAGNNGRRPAKTPQIGPFSRYCGGARCGRAALAALLLLAACGGGREHVAAAPPYADPGFVEAGGVRLHYALTLARDLPAGIARSYGIVQRRNLAVLTVTLAPIEAYAATRPVAPEAEATVISLTGARERLALTRHDETGAPTWLGSVEVRHRVPVTIEIRARATPASSEIRARLTREFRLE